MSDFSVSILHGGFVEDGRNLKDSTLLSYYEAGPATILDPLWKHKAKEVVLYQGYPYLWKFVAFTFPFDHYDIDPSEHNIKDSDYIWVEAWRED